MDDPGNHVSAYGPQLPGLAADVLAGARKIIDDGTPPNTRLAYQRDMKYIAAWCKARAFSVELPFTAIMVVTFIVDHVEGMSEDLEDALVNAQAKRDYGVPAISTVRRRVATMSTAHSLAGVYNPCKDQQVADLLQRAGRAARRKGWAPAKKIAAPMAILNRLLETCDADQLIDRRDRALLLFGFSSGGRRRSEIAEAVIERLHPQGDAFVYDLGITKTSQDGDTGHVPVAGRAASAMHLWLRDLGEESGAIFRRIWPDGRIGSGHLSDKAIALMIKRRAKKAGLDPSKFSGHSLRSGFMTEAGIRNISFQDAMKMSTHRTVQVAAAYYQAGSALHNKGANLAD